MIEYSAETLRLMHAEATARGILFSHLDGVLERAKVLAETHTPLSIVALADLADRRARHREASDALETCLREQSAALNAEDHELEDLPAGGGA